ncbi:MAG: rRNA maturation RNase YbeY [Burkholderiaceae bacterium]
MAEKRPAPELTLQFGRGVSIRPLTAARLRRLAAACAPPGWAFTLRFTTRAEARSLNTRYRDRDYTPNVLTFPYPQQQAGDIVICTAVVREQAREQGKRYADHLSHMVVHGLLHAQGHDHEKPGPARRMEALERRILAGLGITDPYA